MRSPSWHEHTIWYQSNFYAHLIGLKNVFSRPLARGVSFAHPNIHIFLCTMQWDEKELDIQFTPNVHFWTPNSEILARPTVRN